MNRALSIADRFEVGLSMSKLSTLSSIWVGIVSDNVDLMEELQTQLTNLTQLDESSPQSSFEDLDIVLVDDDVDYTIPEIAKNIPHVLLVDVTQTDLNTVLGNGLADYIPKPIIPNVLEHRIKQVLALSNQQKLDLQLQQDYETILLSMSEPIFVFDRTGKYIRIPINQTENYVQPPEDMLGKYIHDHFPQHLANRFLQTIQTALDTQSHQIIDYVLDFEDRIGYFSAIINPVQGRDEVVWVARDVTDNKLSELALRETEQRYQHLFENANDMILTVDLQTGKILSANKQAQKQLGYTLAELLELTINQVEVSEMQTQSQVVTRTLATSGSIVVEQTFLSKDKVLIPVETSSRFITQGDRKVLLSFSRNIKQRKAAMQAEADERYFAEVLRDSISQLATVHTLDEVLDVMLATVVKVVDNESSNIMFIEDDTARVVRVHGFHDPESQPITIDIPSAFTLRQMRDTKQSIIIANTMTDPRWITFSDSAWSKSYIGAPIKLDDDVIGYINLDSSIPNHFTNKHRQRLQAFADQATIAIQNAKLYEANLVYTEDLEARVTERTKELTQTNEELLTQITKRIQAEESLSEERNLLRTIINSLPDTVYVKNRQGEYILANRFPFTTEPEQPFIGKTDLDLISNKSLAQHQYDIEQQLMTTGDIDIVEDYFITVQGDERWKIRTKVPFYDDNGSIIGLIGVNQDITQIKMAERQLLQLLSNAQCLLWYANVEFNGTSYQWSVTVENEDTARKFLPFDTTNKSYTDAWLASISETDKSLRHTVASTHLRYNQSNYKIDYQCTTTDGLTHWLSEDVQIQKITESRWHLVGVSLDVTARKSAEMALRETNLEMEHRVIERTEALQRANEDLQNEIQIRQQAEAAERRQRLLAETLKDTLTAMNSTLKIEDVLEQLLNGIENVVEHNASNIMLIEDDTLRMVHQRGYNYTIPDFPLSKFKDVKIVYQTKRPLILHDTHEDETWVPWEPSAWIRSSIKVPIVYNDSVVGIIILDSDQTNSFTDQHAETLQTFADQASIALNNARLYQQAQVEITERKRAEAAEREQRQFAEILRETAITLNQDLTTGNIFDTILTAIEKIVSVHDTASIILFENDTLTGRVVRSRGFENFEDSIDNLEIDFSISFTKQQLLHTHNPILIQDTRESDMWIELPPTRWIRSHIAIPIYIKDNLLALINLDSQNPNVFSEEHVERLLIFSHQVATAFENAQLIEQIQNYTQHLESRVELRTRELEFERSQLRAILNAMRDGVYYTNTARESVYINNALSDMTGYPREMWLSGQVFEQANRAVEQDRQTFWDNVEMHLETNEFWEAESPLTRFDGSRLDVRLTRTKVMRPDGTLEGVVTVVRDISLQKQLEEQKARFIANAAHELRTPITNVKTRLFLMRHNPEKFREHLAIAESAISWMQSLVENLFEHSRFERGIIQLDVEEILLQDFLNTIIITQQAEAIRKNIHIIPEWHTAEIRINLDKSRFRQVITNLLNNAIHYTPEDGTITISVKQVSREGTPYVIINVIDTGIGIAESHLPHLFQPFYRAVEDGKGAGLGLSIAHEIIEAHKGTIAVESTISEGTTFAIILPMLTKEQLSEDI